MFSIYLIFFFRVEGRESPDGDTLSLLLLSTSPPRVQLPLGDLQPRVQLPVSDLLPWFQLPR